MNTAADTSSNAPISIARFGVWEFNSLQNTLTHIESGEVQRLEPKVSELLSVLLSAGGKVVLKQTLIDKLWGNVIVGEDTLARTISRLRSALSDSASNPQYIETIPKRGYRMMMLAESSPVQNIETKKGKSFLIPALSVLFVLSIFVVLTISPGPSNEITEKLDRADGLYMQFQEQSNEAALALYQEVVNIEPNNSRAQAGVANAMVQRVVRWPEEPYKIDVNNISLTSALRSGQLGSPEAKLMLERARLIAERAVRQSPKDIQAHKSLGFVYSAEGKIERAIEQYQKAIELDENAWRSLVNLGELQQLNNQNDEALQSFIRAFNAMQNRFAVEPQHIGPWQPSLGNVIAESFLNQDDHENAELWAQKVLDLVPFERNASDILLSALINQNKQEQAKLFCESYATKLESPEDCQNL